jgi:hypothetical protein
MADEKLQGVHGYLLVIVMVIWCPANRLDRESGRPSGLDIEKIAEMGDFDLGGYRPADAAQIRDMFDRVGLLVIGGRLERCTVSNGRCGSALG